MTTQAHAVRIQPSNVGEMRVHAADLIAANLLEAHKKSRGHTLAVAEQSWDGFTKLEAAGVLAILAAWDGNIMVGYTVMVRTVRLTTCENVVQCSIYVDPEYRKKGLASRLMRASEELARINGPVKFLMGLKNGDDFSKVLLHRGYWPLETHYEVSLG